MKSLPQSVKVLVIGAGPAGGSVGRLLTEAGWDVLVLEEHKEVGKPVQCSGMVGGEFFEGRKFDIGRDFVINSIDGSRVEYADSDWTLVRKDVAWVLDRALLDQTICRGVPVQTETKFLGFTRDGGQYVVETTQGTIRCDYLIGADGPHSKVRQAAGMHADSKIFQAVQYRIETEKGNSHMVDVRFIRPFSHFSWMIPEGNGVARVGTVSDTPLQDHKKYMADRGIEGKIIQSIGGPIPLGFSQLQLENISLVGDAGCQVKPITSGGIFYAVRAAELLVECLLENKYAEYPQRWEQTLGKEIRFCFQGREVLEKTSPETLCKIFWFFGEKKEVLENAGEFDMHSSVFWNLVKDPRAYTLAGSLIWDLLTRTRSRHTEARKTLTTLS